MGCTVIGIAGGSASGKTTLAGALAECLQAAGYTVQQLPMDRYFYRGAPGGPMFTSPTTGEVLPHNNCPESADNARLAADIDAVRALAAPPDFAIVEGLMALAVDAVRARLDVKVFVDLEPDLRALRRLLRDMRGGRGNADPEWIARYYIECARPGHIRWIEPSRVHADIIVRGDADAAGAAAEIAAAWLPRQA